METMSNYKYLVTYGKLLYDKNDFIPFLVETTAPISTALHFKVLKNRAVAAPPHRSDDLIPISVSLLLPGISPAVPADFSVISFELVHPEAKSQK